MSPPSYQQRELALGDLARDWVPIASGRHSDAVVSLGSASSTLWVSVLPTGISRRLPDGDLLHVYLARGVVDVDTIGRLEPGDSLRLSGARPAEALRTRRGRGAGMGDGSGRRKPTMSTLRVAVAQILSGADPQQNLELVATRTAEAADQGAQLVVFPEATMRRFGLPLAEIAEPVDGPWAKQLREIAEHHELVVLAGMFSPSADGRVNNTLRVVGPGVDAHYHKIHLFDAFGFRESDTVAPGAEPVVITVGGARGRAHFVLRHQVSRPVHETCRSGSSGDLRGRLLGCRTGQGRAVAAADPGTCAGQHVIPGCCCAGGPSRNGNFT